MPLDIRRMISRKKQAITEKKLKLNEGRLMELKAEADQAKRVSKQLEEEKKYRAELNNVKDLKREARAARLAPVKKYVGKIRENIKKNSGSNIDFETQGAKPFSSGSNPFYPKSSETPKQKAKNITIKLE